jgi:hypothetical protein
MEAFSIFCHGGRDPRGLLTSHHTALVLFFTAICNNEQQRKQGSDN